MPAADDPERYGCYRVLDRDAKPTPLLVYCLRRTVEGEQLAMWSELSSGPINCMVTMRYGSAESQAETAEIAEFLQEGWLVASPTPRG